MDGFAQKNNSSFQTLQQESITINGKLIGFFKSLEITQSIQNKTSSDINEMIYVFSTGIPLCILGLTFFIGEKKI